MAKERIDLEQDPPPDLAIGMDLTSLTDKDQYAIGSVAIRLVHPVPLF